MSYPIGNDTPDGFRGIENITGLQDVPQPGGGGPIRDQAELVRGNFFTAVLGGFASIGHAIGGFLEELVSAFFGNYTGSDPNLIAYQDGQLALNDRQDLLSPLLDYGSTYMNNANSISAAGPLKFRNQVGPMQGCRVATDSSGNSIILEDKGLWDIRCQIWVDFINILGGTVDWEVRVHRPNGSVFSKMNGSVTSQQRLHSTILCSVVVPDASYGVGVFITNIAALRGVLGGPNLNRLTVQHISRETEIGDTGQ